MNSEKDEDEEVKGCAALLPADISEIWLKLKFPVIFQELFLKEEFLEEFGQFFKLKNFVGNTKIDGSLLKSRGYFKHVVYIINPSRQNLFVIRTGCFNLPFDE